MSDNILKQGKGSLVKLSVDSVGGTSAFSKDAAKALFIEILCAKASENVCLIAYCVCEHSAHFIVKGENDDSVKDYVRSVMTAFSTVKGDYFANAFRAEYEFRRLRPTDLLNYINGVHALSRDPMNDPYASFNYIMSGTNGATAVICAELGEVSQDDFLTMMQESGVQMFGSPAKGLEHPKAVLKDCRERYLAKGNATVDERSIIATIGEVCERTHLSYTKTVKKLGISPKSRHDLLISTVTDMIVRKNKTYNDTVGILKLEEGYETLMHEAVAEINRKYQYSYDYIENRMGLYDIDYDKLVAILCGMHKKFRLSFEQLVKKFHLQNDIPRIRARCGF